ncbi:MAG: hypothetical protein IIA63_07375 [Nitrospinae bacterium]|nr:hypothetical protein [Nitrospinota bacterium]
MSFNLGDYHLSVEKLSHFFAITIGPFVSEKDACNFFEKIQAGFFWWSLTDRIGISFSQNVSSVKFFDSPKPTVGNFKHFSTNPGLSEIEGHYDADKVVIRPEHKKLIRFETGQPKITISSSVEHLKEKISETLELGNPEKVIADEKLKLSIELYSASFYEYSENTQFISLINVLEAITPEDDIANHAQKILKQAMLVIKGNRVPDTGKPKNQTIRWLGKG